MKSGALRKEGRPFLARPDWRWEPAFSKNMPPAWGGKNHGVVEGGRLRPLSVIGLDGRPLNNVGRQYK